MKKFSYYYRLLSVAFIAAAFACQGFAAPMELTDSQGRSIKADIQAVVGDTVTIRRNDGHEFVVDISMFSLESQALIRAWEKTSVYTKADVLRITSQAVNGKRNKTQSGATEVTKWMAHYKITLENREKVPMKNLRVEYRYWVFDQAVAAQKRSQGTRRLEKGKIDVEFIDRWDTLEVRTEETELIETELASGWYYAGGGDDDSKDKLDGIWVRVYHGDILVTEYASTDSIMREHKWDEPETKR